MKESKPKYLEIADAIHQEIRQEIYKQGDKLPVERELQERFGASRMTIRHALQSWSSREWYALIVAVVRL